MADYSRLLERWYRRLLKPFSADEEQARQEYILNILLAGSVIISAIAALFVLRDYWRYAPNFNGVPPVVILTILLFFITLYGLSRFRFYRLSAYIFIFFYFMIGTYVTARWGIVIAQGWMVYVFVIVMASVLIGTWYGGLMTALVIAVIFGETYLVASGRLIPNYYWLNQAGQYKDAINYSLALTVIGVVGYLSNREIERSLQRAQRSERALTEERDQLEVRVEKRTQALMKAQRDEVAQLERFAQFGRLASDLVHDIINPLTSVSLNIEQLGKGQREGLVKRARAGISSMERFIDSARKQLQNQAHQELFSPFAEARLASEMLKSRAHRSNVKIQLSGERQLQTFGDPVKFHKVAVNLLSNAIDACEERPGKTGQVKIHLSSQGNIFTLTVQDNGAGITPAQQSRVFELFYTTKSARGRTGLGLALTKEVVEQSFGGQINLKSSRRHGTLLTVTFPLRLDND